jgi:hypothetical protein
VKRATRSAATVSSGLFVGGALAVLLVPVGFAVSGSPELQVLVELEESHPPPAATTSRATRAKPRIEELSCFGCHNIEHYQTAEKFPHKQHRKSGHCHVCHAFTGHAESVIRKEACVECH